MTVEEIRKVQERANTDKAGSAWEHPNHAPAVEIKRVPLSFKIGQWAFELPAHLSEVHTVECQVENGSDGLETASIKVYLDTEKVQYGAMICTAREDGIKGDPLRSMTNFAFVTDGDATRTPEEE